MSEPPAMATMKRKDDENENKLFLSYSFGNNDMLQLRLSARSACLRCYLQQVVERMCGYAWTREQNGMP